MTLQHDGTSSRSGSSRDAAVEDALLDRLRALGTQFAVHPGEEYRAAARARLVAMAAVRGPVAARRPGAAQRPLRGLPGRGAGAPALRRWTAGLAGAALTVSAVGGVVAASQAARPGDLLYGVKRGGEHTRLALAGDSTRGRTLLGFASTRLTELTELTRSGTAALPAGAPPAAGGPTVLAAGPRTALVVGTLDAMDQQTTEGTWWLTTRALADHDAAALTVLATWAQGQATGLADLTGAIPPEEHGPFTAATELVAAVAARGAGLGVAMDCPGGPATEGSDDLGPLPTACPSVPADASAAAAPSTGGSAGASGAAPSTGGPGPSMVAPDPATGTGAPATGAPGPGGGAGPTPARGGVRVPVPAVPTPALPTLSLPTPAIPTPALPTPAMPTPRCPP